MHSINQSKQSDIVQKITIIGALASIIGLIVTLLFIFIKTETERPETLPLQSSEQYTTLLPQPPQLFIFSIERQ